MKLRTMHASLQGFQKVHKLIIVQPQWQYQVMHGSKNMERHSDEQLAIPQTRKRQHVHGWTNPNLMQHVIRLRVYTENEVVHVLHLPLGRWCIWFMLVRLRMHAEQHTRRARETVTGASPQGVVRRMSQSTTVCRDISLHSGLHQKEGKVTGVHVGVDLEQLSLEVWHVHIVRLLKCSHQISKLLRQLWSDTVSFDADYFFQHISYFGDRRFQIKTRNGRILLKLPQFPP
mmetsp:Transcript_26723/g.47564  ORF Transcript_26723/g.47564 Transcript_26723/m.47564 type:complete len:230 (-) Transcript_26723:1660-2349(-)